MIFQTFNNDLDGLINKIGVFNKSFQNIGRDLSSGQGIITSLFSGKNVTTQDIKNINAMEQAMKNGATTAQAWQENMTGCTVAAKQQVKQCLMSKESLTTLTTKLETTTIATKAATVATKALAIAGNMIAVWAITELISGLRELSQVSEDVAEKAQELGNTFKSTKSDIDDYKEQIEELYETINNSNSSIEDVTTARKNLMTVQDELIEKFGTEKDTIDLVTDAINGQTEAFDKLTQKQWQETLNDFNDSGFWNNVSNFFHGYSDNVERMLDEYGNYTARIDLSKFAGFLGNEQYQEFRNLLVKTYGADITLDGTKTIAEISGNATEVYEKLLAIQNLSDDFEFNNSFSKELTKLATSAKDISEEYEDMYNQYILYEKIFDSEDYTKAFKEITDAYNTYQDAFVSGDDDAISQALENYSNIVGTAITEALENGDNSVADYFKNMYPALQSIVDQWEFKTNIIPTFDISGIEGKTEADILEMLQTDGIQEGEEVFNSIIDSAIEYGIITDDNAESIQALLDLLVEWGILQGEISDSVADVELDDTGWSGFTDDESDAIDNFQSKVKTLSDTLSSLRSGEDIDLTDLIQEFPELAGESDNLEQAIIDLINNALSELYNLLGEGLPSEVKDDLQELADATINAVPALDEAFSAIQQSYSALNDFKEAMNNDQLTDSILSSVTALSTHMSEMVAGFYAGVVSVEQLYDALTDCYNTDLENYSKALIAKNEYSEEFYNAVGLASADVVNQFLEDYGVDLKNCKNYNEAKLKIEQQTLQKISSVWSSYYKVQYDAATREFSGAYDALVEAAENGDAVARAQLSAIQQQIDNYKAAMEECMKLFL